MAGFFEYELWPTFHDFDNFPLFNAMFPEQFFNDVLQPNYLVISINGTQPSTLAPTIQDASMAMTKMAK